MLFWVTLPTADEADITFPDAEEDGVAIANEDRKSTELGEVRKAEETWLEDCLGKAMLEAEAEITTADREMLELSGSVLFAGLLERDADEEMELSF